MAYIFDDHFSGNILLDIKTTRHIGHKVLFIRLLSYLFGKGCSVGNPRQNVVLLPITPYEYSILYALCHFMDKVYCIDRCYIFVKAYMQF